MDELLGSFDFWGNFNNGLTDTVNDVLALMRASDEFAEGLEDIYNSDYPIDVK